MDKCNTFNFLHIDNLPCFFLPTLFSALNPIKDECIFSIQIFVSDVQASQIHSSSVYSFACKV